MTQEACALVPSPPSGRSQGDLAHYSDTISFTLIIWYAIGGRRKYIAIVLRSVEHPVPGLSDWAASLVHCARDVLPKYVRIQRFPPRLAQSNAYHR